MIKTVILASALFAAREAAAQEAMCELRVSSEIIHVLICPTELSVDVLGAEGQRVCSDSLPCGAWIWTDPDAAPDVAPDNHDGLTQDQVTSARAVWVAETELLIEITEVE